ncbi:putative tail sheath protein [Bdellovibrio phage MAC3UK]|nr:putative tail sheath protein [Bdellovibrio phage MAC3UK]
MNNILLDYFFPITVINPTPAASTAFLKQMCLVVKPKEGSDPAAPVFCATMGEVNALTDNTEAQQCFAAGLTGLYVMTANDLDLASLLDGHEFDFFTLLISSDFSDAHVTGQAGAPAVIGVKAERIYSGCTMLAINEGAAGNSLRFEVVGGGEDGQAIITMDDANTASIQIESGVTTLASIKAALIWHPQASLLMELIIPGGDEANIAPSTGGYLLLAGGVTPQAEVPELPEMNLGAFAGVTGVSSADDAFLEAQSVIENRCAFKSVGNGAKNLIFAFGKLLSNTVNWANQQFVTMPFSDNVSQLGNAKNYFAKRISFVIDDKQYGKRLGFFGCGGKAIVAPYIIRNLVLDMQSAALAYVSANQPGYTKVHAALMEDELQKIITGTEDKPGYITKGWITKGQVEIKLEQANFVASGYIEVSEPGALWRIDGQLKQTTT